MPILTLEQIRFADWQLQHTDSATLWEAMAVFAMLEAEQA